MNRIDIFFIVLVFLTFIYALKNQEKFDLSTAKNKTCIGPYINSELLSEPNQCAGCLSYFADSNDYSDCIKSNLRAMVKSNTVDFKKPENLYARNQVKIACLNPYSPSGLLKSKICKEVM